APALPKRSLPPWIWKAAAGVSLLAAAGLAAWWWMHSVPQASVTRFAILAPEKAAFGFGLALSPDGKRLAFVATPEGGQDLLWVRALDSLTAAPVAGTEGAQFPFWSPDGRTIAFFAQGKLK